VAVGERVWVLRTGKTSATTVTAITATSSKGLHSPVLLNGGFPVVDEIVTAFDSIEKVTLAKHGLKPLIATCKAMGTCEAMLDLFLNEDRELVTSSK